MTLVLSTPTWPGNHVPAALRGIPEVWGSEPLLSDKQGFENVTWAFMFFGNNTKRQYRLILIHVHSHKECPLCVPYILRSANQRRRLDHRYVEVVCKDTTVMNLKFR